jgi:cysteine desulfurase/selenocysteine lyase
MEAVAAHEMELTRYALQRLNRLPRIRIYGSNDPDDLENRLGVIAFEVEGIPHAKIAAILGFEGGIGVRNGCFCAHPYILRLMGVNGDTYQAFKQRVLNHDRSDLPVLVRASFGCYNTLAEVDHLVAMLERIIRGDYRGEYVLHKATGEYLPRNYDPALVHCYFSI